jgi:hypothetical protein
MRFCDEEAVLLIGPTGQASAQSVGSGDRRLLCMGLFSIFLAGGQPGFRCNNMAHPTRFERVTFAFGGRIFVFAINCGCLQTCQKPLFFSHLLMDGVAAFC